MCDRCGCRRFAPFFIINNEYCSLRHLTIKIFYFHSLIKIESLIDITFVARVCPCNRIER